MAVDFITAADLRAALVALSAHREVIAPVESAGTFGFSRVTGAEGLDLDAGLTTIPPKDAFFPQTQTLLRYRHGENLEILPEPGPGADRVLAGVRPCDVRSVGLLDRVFLQGPFTDGGYSNGRQGSVIISVGCARARSTCFCTSMGASPSKAPGADLFLFPFRDGYSVEAYTPAGEGLLEAMRALGATITALDPSEGAALGDAKAEAEAGVTLNVDADGVGEVLEGLFEDGLWAEQAEKCLGCGVCSYVCPTCHCFDIHDEAEGTEGRRIRCWDCCMFADFTRMAGGHNPRPTKTERVRQRFMHKLRYFKANNGDHACVGCGRCLAKCPAGMDITEIIGEAKARVRL